jgi:L-histidine N-alpha-methyltransferase
MPLSPLAEVIVRGLTSAPKSLPPRVLYDERGSRLFEQITTLPEYYPTAAERGLLVASAPTIAERTGLRTLVELGAGVLDKSRILIDAGLARGTLTSYVPVDISAEVLMKSARELQKQYPLLSISPVEADFMGEWAIGGLASPVVISFLGGTIGNLFPRERVDFFRRMCLAAGAGNYLVVGTDLVKDVDRIVDAYFDSQGITEAFLLNVVEVMNDECGLGLSAEDFDYVPLWDARESRMDLRLRARRELSLNLPGGTSTCRIAEEEEIRIEVSSKFTREQVCAELRAGGATVVEQFDDGDFALTLAVVDS